MKKSEKRDELCRKVVSIENEIDFWKDVPGEKSKQRIKSLRKQKTIITKQLEDMRESS